MEFIIAGAGIALINLVLGFILALVAIRLKDEIK